MLDRSLVDYLTEDLLSGLSGLSAKQMFGGFGLYWQGVIVGIIYEGELYLKVDDKLKQQYQALDSHQFIYQSKDRRVAMPYMSVPADVLENREALIELLEESFVVSTSR